MDEDQLINHMALTACMKTNPMDCSDTTVSTPVTTSSDTTSNVVAPPGTPNERSIETDGMYYSDSKCSSGDEELSDNEIEKAYENIHFKWVQLCKLNKKLEVRVTEVVNEKDSLKKAVANYEIRLTKKDNNLQETRTQLEETQKSLKILNSRTAKLDHIFSFRKPYHDHYGLGYIGKASTSKIVFVKESSPPNPRPYSGTKSKLALLSRKPKRFVSTCHYYGISGHIRPRYYKYQNALKRDMVVNPPYSA